MIDGKIPLTSENFNVPFLTEDSTTVNINRYKSYYKVLIADDENEVHISTKLILKNFVFEDMGLEFLDSYNFSETIDLLKENNQIAIVLLDVVMDEQDSGLKVIKYIRNTLNNIFTRIILRTGQPGLAPEDKIIVDYDINDYLLKTDISVQRLYTSLYQSLRAYRDMLFIDNNKKGLEKINKCNTHMFAQDTFQDFLTCILNELYEFRLENAGFNFCGQNTVNGFVISESAKCGVVIAATGHYNKYIGKKVNDISELYQIYKDLLAVAPTSIAEIVDFRGGVLISKKSPNNMKVFIYMESSLDKFNLEFIKIFLTNYSLALDNYSINQQIMDTQIEIIHTLGDAIEKRSHETANHVRRVSEMAYIIANKMGLSQQVCGLIKIISTMHDVGKIGILDDILLKPGRLSSEEFEIIKTHSEIGYKIFAKSSLEILKDAAVICLNHHEKYDGSGYPRGVSGEAIPLFARIVTLCDVYDAIIHRRCYKDAMSIEEAEKYITDQSGISFDPEIVRVFLENMDEINYLNTLYPE